MKLNVSLVSVDSHNFPNLALCKIAGFYRDNGHTVDWYSPMFSNPDMIYASKVFSFTPDYFIYNPDHPTPMQGGTGYNFGQLPAYIENHRPDFTIYEDSIMRNPRTRRLQAFGFLTRGCIRSCKWCIVPKKEGHIRPVSSIEAVAQDRKEAVLLDNNFLAAEPAFVEDQLSRIRQTEIRIDFNQGLDARLITPESARLLAACKWIRFIRFSCDTEAMIEPIRRAVQLLRENGCRREIFCYMLIQDIADAEKRLKALVELNISPFAQPFRDFESNSKPTYEQEIFAAYANIKGGKIALKKTFAEYLVCRRNKHYALRTHPELI